MRPLRTASLLVLACTSLGVAPAMADIAFDEKTFGTTEGADPRQIETFDLDGDGDRDALVATGNYANDIQLWRAQPAGTLTEVALPGPGALAIAHPADVTGDGRPDVVYARGGQGGDTFPPRAIIVHAGGPSGLAAPVTTVLPRAADVATADFDGDAHADAIAAIGGQYAGSPDHHDPSGGFAVLHGQAGGTFTIGQTVTFPDTDVLSVEAGDFNGDGLADAVLQTLDGTRLALGTAAGGVPTGVLTVPPAVDAETLTFVALEVADVDRDGRDDVIASRCCSAPSGTTVRRGRADGTLQAPAQVFAEPMYDLAVGDVDDDGELDVVGGDRQTDTGVAVAFGNGDGTFDGRESYPLAGIGGTTGIFRVSAVAAADLTGDGVDDILAGDAYSYTGVMSLLRNAPYLTVSALDVDFGPLAAGAHATRPLQVGNRGVAALNVASVAVEGSGFSVDADGCSAKRLAYGETCALALGYTGTGSGDDEGRVVLRSDDAEPQLAFGLYGFGLPQPQVAVPPPPAPVAPPPPPPPPPPPTVSLSAADSASTGLRVALAAVRRAGIRGLRAGKVRFSFKAPAGVVRVSLTEQRSPRSRSAGRVLATSTARATSTSNVTMRLRPTTAGRTRLRRARRVAATLRVVVTPTRGGARTRSARTVLAAR